MVFTSNAYDILPLPIDVGVLDKDNVVGENDALLDKLTASERIQDSARKAFLPGDERDKLALIDVFFYLISQAPGDADDILALSRVDELPLFMNLVASSAQVAARLNAMVQVDEYPYSRDDLSITAIGWFMCRLSRLILWKDYWIDLDEFSELNTLHNLERISYQIGHLPVFSTRPHQTVGRWLGLFNKYNEGLVGDSNGEAPLKEKILIGPYRRSRWNRAKLWQSGAVLKILPKANYVSEIQLSAKIKGKRVKLSVKKINNEIGNLTYKFSIEDNDGISESVAVDDAFSVYANGRDKKYYSFVETMFSKGSDVRYQITSISNAAEADENRVVDSDIYDSFVPAEGGALPINDAVGRNDGLLDKLTTEENILDKARVVFPVYGKDSTISLLDVFFYLVALQVAMDLLDSDLNLQQEDQLSVFMRKVTSGTKIAATLNNMAGVDKVNYTEADLSAAAVGRFMRRLAILILAKYGIDPTGFAKSELLQRIEKIADKLVVRSTSHDSPRRIVSYWLALFSQYHEEWIKLSTTTTVVPTTPKAKRAPTLGPEAVDSVRKAVKYVAPSNEIILLDYDKGDLFYQTPTRMKATDVSRKLYNSVAETADLVFENREILPPGGPADGYIPAEANLKLPGLYLTRPGDTLRSIAVQQLYYRGHARQLAYLNRDLRSLEECGAIRNKVDFAKGAVIEDNVDINKKIPADTVIKLPFISKMDAKVDFNLSTPDFYGIFYGPDSYDGEIEVWNNIGLYEGGVGVYDEEAKKVVWYVLGPR